MRETKTYDLGYAKVTIHPGKLSDEEFNAVLREATIDFMKAVMRQRATQKHLMNQTSPTGHPDQR